MKEVNLWKVCTAVSFTGMMIIAILSLYAMNYDKPKPLKNVTISDCEQCSNLSLRETSFCLTSWVDTFFYYNISNVGKDLSLDELKNRGAFVLLGQIYIIL